MRDEGDNINSFINAPTTNDNENVDNKKDPKDELYLSSKSCLLLMQCNTYQRSLLSSCLYILRIKMISNECFTRQRKKMKYFSKFSYIQFNFLLYLASTTQLGICCVCLEGEARCFILCDDENGSACGHDVCVDCVNKFYDCPVCRQKIHSYLEVRDF